MAVPDEVHLRSSLLAVTEAAEVAVATLPPPQQDRGLPGREVAAAMVEITGQHRQAVVAVALATLAETVQTIREALEDQALLLL